jgi:hypothetical protein
MNADETNTTNAKDDSRPPATFQFSLLEFLVLITLISVVTGLTSRFAGVEAVWALFGGSVLVSLLCVFAHFVAEWLLTPPERRSYIWASPVFWSAVGFVLLATTTSAMVEFVDRWTDPRKPDFSPSFLYCTAAATACSFFAAAYCWRRRKAKASHCDVDDLDAIIPR